MSHAYDEEAMKPLPGRFEPRRPWWVKWAVLVIFVASISVGAKIAWMIKATFGL